MSSQQWFNIFKPVDKPKLRLVCFPYAGGGASIYRDWPQYLPNYVELLSMQLPGRENRIKESVFTNLSDAMSSFNQALFPKLDVPFIFFGHSMGALIAYEYARFLKNKYKKEPIRIFISGRSAPDVVRRGKNLSALNDNELIDEIINMGGSKALQDYPQLAKLFIETIRSDFSMMDNYKFITGELLSCPITLMSGKDDGSYKEEELDAWKDHTQGKVNKRIYSGGHFYINHHAKDIIEDIFQETYQGLQK